MAIPCRRVSDRSLVERPGGPRQNRCRQGQQDPLPTGEAQRRDDPEGDGGIAERHEQQTGHDEPPSEVAHPAVRLGTEVRRRDEVIDDLRREAGRFNSLDDDCGRDVPGGIRTLARSDARLTRASTPSSALSLFSIRATQAPQVIPPMERDTSVSGVAWVVGVATPKSVAVNEGSVGRPSPLIHRPGKISIRPSICSVYYKP